MGVICRCKQEAPWVSESWETQAVYAKADEDRRVLHVDTRRTRWHVESEPSVRAKVTIAAKAMDSARASVKAVRH